MWVCESLLCCVSVTNSKCDKLSRTNTLARRGPEVGTSSQSVGGALSLAVMSWYTLARHITHEANSAFKRLSESCYGHARTSDEAAKL